MNIKQNLNTDKFFVCFFCLVLVGYHSKTKQQKKTIIWLLMITKQCYQVSQKWKKKTLFNYEWMKPIRIEWPKRKIQLNQTETKKTDQRNQFIINWIEFGKKHIQFIKLMSELNRKKMSRTNKATKNRSKLCQLWYCCCWVITVIFFFCFRIDCLTLWQQQQQSETKINRIKRERERERERENQQQQISRVFPKKTKTKWELKILVFVSSIRC